jgi:hypothetical protein
MLHHPNFIVIDAQKAGTTCLSVVLLASPAVL